MSEPMSLIPALPISPGCWLNTARTCRPEEQDRFRQLSQRCAEAMDDAIRAVKPGMSENAIATLLAYESPTPRRTTYRQPHRCG